MLSFYEGLPWLLLLLFPGSRAQPNKAVKPRRIPGSSGDRTASPSEPFEVGRFKLEGMADPSSPVPHIKIGGKPRRERRSLPLSRLVARADAARAYAPFVPH
jgi:hypothetical protein